MFDTLKSMVKDALSWLSSSFYFGNIIEIIILTVCVYYIILWFKTTRAWTLLKGLLILLAVMAIASIFNLQVISSILDRAFSVGLIALIILFQPELRRALEQLGRRNFFSGIFDVGPKGMRFSDESLNALLKACYDMGRTKTGALIVIENNTPLGEYEKTGIPLDSKITPQLLIQIFEKNTPLHDGAIIIRNDRIVAATCYLPVSNNMMISKDLGTRHRAAMGISEISDSLTLIVSEETGSVSIARSGEIIRDLERSDLNKYLIEAQNRPDESKTKGLNRIRRRRSKDRDEKDSAE